MVKSNGILEIEIDGERNENLYFQPLQRKIRGRFDASRLAKYDDAGGSLMRKWEGSIPSQRLQLDASRETASIVEPLLDSEHSVLREKIEAQGFKIAENQEFEAVDCPTILFWAQRAVFSGLAKIVSGSLPDKIEGEPKKSFIVNRDSANDPMEKLAESMDRFSAAVEKISDLLQEKLK